MFRPAITPMFVCVLALGLPLSFLEIVILHGWRFACHFALINSTIAAVVAFLWALLLHFSFPVRISAEGVLGHSGWGLRRFIAWEHISMACTFRLLNLRWIRLYSLVDGKTTWVALFLSKPDGFRAELHRLAPPQSPIFQYFT